MSIIFLTRNSLNLSHVHSLERSRLFNSHVHLLGSPSHLRMMGQGWMGIVMLRMLQQLVMGILLEVKGGWWSSHTQVFVGLSIGRRFLKKTKSYKFLFLKTYNYKSMLPYHIPLTSLVTNAGTHTHHHKGNKRQKYWTHQFNIQVERCCFQLIHNICWGFCTSAYR